MSNKPEETSEPEWTFAPKVQCLPTNATTYGQRLSAPRRDYFLDTEVEAKVTAETERCIKEMGVWFDKFIEGGPGTSSYEDLENHIMGKS